MVFNEHSGQRSKVMCNILKGRAPEQPIEIDTSTEAIRNIELKHIGKINIFIIFTLHLHSIRLEKYREMTLLRYVWM